MIKHTLFILLAFCISKLSSQETLITGLVSDTSGIFLDHASAILLNQDDSTMITYAFTKTDGSFEVKYNRSGNYLLQLNYIGFETKWIKITIQPSKALILIGKIILKRINYNLAAVEIHAKKPPIKFGKDTIEYNASSFKTYEGDLVEDLLKKLPGVEVEPDGSIKAFGEKVENVLVDGKEFFGKDTRIATKNLEADAVDKVQVFDKKSESAAFTGIKDGKSEKSINLQLKENKKNGYFGNAKVAYGSSQRFSAKAQLNKFTAESRFSFIGNANNTNEQSFSIQDYIDFMGGIGAFMSGGNARVRIDLNDIPGLPIDPSGQISGIQNTYAAGINYNCNLTTKSELSSSIFAGNLSNVLNEQSIRQNLNTVGSYSTTEDRMQNSGNENYNLNLFLKHNFDSTQVLSIRLNGSAIRNNLINLTRSKSFDAHSSILNESNIDFISAGQNFPLRSTFSWMKHLNKPGRNLATKFTGTYRNNSRNSFIYAINNYYITNLSDSIIQKQILDNAFYNYDLGVSYTEPLGRNYYLELNLLKTNQNHKTKNEFFDRDDKSNETLNILQSKNFQSSYSLNAAGANILISKDKLNLTAGFSLQQALLSGNIIPEPNTAVSKVFKNILPAVFGEYRPETSKHFNFEYQTFLQEPSIEQLQPVTDNTDPLNLYTGNPGLRPEYRHELNINYFNYNAFYFRSLFCGLHATYVEDQITEIVNIDSLYRRMIQPVNVAFEKSIRANFDFSTPIKPLKSNLRIRTATGLSDGFLYLNELRDKINRYRINLNISLDNRNKDIADVMVGWKINATKTTYASGSQLNQNYNEQSIYSEFTIHLTGDWLIKSNFEYRFYNSSFNAEKIILSLWEMSISKHLLKNNKLRLELKAFDILNENKGIRRSSQQNYSEELRSNVPGRYVLLQIAYAIRGFSTKRTGSEIRIEDGR
jgi:hypothetical protein